MDKQYFNAAQASLFLDLISNSLMIEHDAINDLELTEDYHDVDRLMFDCFSQLYGTSFQYEQFPLLRSILSLLIANSSVLALPGKEDDFSLEDEQLAFDF